MVSHCGGLTYFNLALEERELFDLLKLAHDRSIQFTLTTVDIARSVTRPLFATENPCECDFVRFESKPSK